MSEARTRMASAWFTSSVFLYPSPSSATPSRVICFAMLSNIFT